MTSHSIIAPSSADRWFYCEGSIALAAAYPEEDSDDTREGDAAHWLATNSLLSSEFKLDNWVGKSAPNHVVVTDDMYWGAVAYREAVLKYVPLDQLHLLHIEEKVQIPRVHPDLAFGTPDTWYYDARTKTLHVWDYKFGHLPVNAWENLQLIMYAAGILDILYEQGVLDIDVKLRFEIIQPRKFASTIMDVWEIPATDIRGTVNRLRDQAEKGLSSSATTHAGSWCEFCPARHACDAHRTATGAAVDYTGKAIPNELSPEAISFELQELRRASKLIKSRLDALEVEAENKIRSGTAIPGNRLEPREGKRRWTIEDSEVISIGRMFGADLAEPTKAKSPRQAELELKEKAIDDAVISPYIEKPKSGMKLVEDDGSRIRFLLSQQEKTDV